MNIKYLSYLLIAFLLITCGEESKSGLDKKQSERKISVKTKTASPRNLTEYISITGKLEGIVDITMSSQTSGRIVKLNKELGDWVEEGEQIGRIDNEQHRISVKQAEASVLSAESNYENANLQMESAEELYKNDNISESEYIQNKSRLKSAKAQLEGAKANLETAEKAYENSKFVSPVSGKIVNLPIEVGETISRGQALCGIVDSRKLIIKTGLSEEDVPNVQEGRQVLIFYDGYSDTVKGSVRGVGIKPLPQSANYPIEIKLDNKDDKLYPGMVVEARIVSRIYEDVFYTSVNNIKQVYGQDYIYVVDKNNRAHLREVELGAEIEDNVVIEEGVEFGEEIVTEGIENLEDGVTVQPQNNSRDDNSKM